jgi:hypothetical protein
MVGQVGELLLVDKNRYNYHGLSKTKDQPPTTLSRGGGDSAALPTTMNHHTNQNIKGKSDGTAAMMVQLQTMHNCVATKHLTDRDGGTSPGGGRGAVDAATAIASRPDSALNDDYKILRPYPEKDSENDDTGVAGPATRHEDRVVATAVAQQQRPLQQLPPGAYAVTEVWPNDDDSDESWCTYDAATTVSERDTSNKNTPGHSGRNRGSRKLSTLPRAMAIDSLEDDPAHLPAAKEFDPETEAFRAKQLMRRQRTLLVVAVVVFATSVLMITLAATQWPNSQSRLGSIENALRKNPVLFDVEFSDSHGYKKALDWMAFDDRQQLSGPAKTRTSRLTQRFLLAATYYATQPKNHTHTWDYCVRSTPGGGYHDFCIGHRQIRGKRWLSNYSECSWIGVTCEKGMVKELNLQHFGLQGPFPHAMAALESLVSINLAGNALSGTVPSQFFTLPLTFVQFSDNNLSGSLEGFKRFTDLFFLDLSNNRLTGSIPDFSSQALLDIALSSNNLVGSVPATIGNLTSLEALRLDHNALVGAIPPTLGNLRNLKFLDLEQNAIEDAIPSSLFHCRELQFVNLSKNQLRGQLDSQVWRLPKLHALLLSGNRFSGLLPTNEEPLTDLRFISISGNRFSGTFPESLCLGKKLTAIEPDCSMNDTVASEQSPECDCCSSCCTRLSNSGTSCEV